MRFAGGRDDIDPQLTADMQGLNALSPEQLSQFVDAILAFLLAPATTDIMASIGAFATAHGISPKTLKGPLRSLLVFFQGLVKHGVTPQHALEDCAALGVGEAGAKLLAEKWGASGSALAHVSTGRALKVDELADMEWKFGVTSATHELQSVGNTFLQLKLSIDRGGVKESRHMELTLPQFYQFLMQMEKAKSQLDFMAE